jgi:transmembrane sensor
MNARRNDIEEAAATWDARLRGARATFRDRSAFQAWLEQNPEHQSAHDRLQAALATLRTHAELPELSALRDEARAAVDQGRRRRIFSALSAVAAAVVLLILAVGSQTDRGAEIAAMLQGDKIYATSRDERTRVTLADGSVVTLDARTRLSVRLGKDRREITLLGGRALFEVAKDRNRPFIVRAGDRTVTALGTVFDVRLGPDELRVTLAEGAVAVRPIRPERGSGKPSVQILKPRQQFVEIGGAVMPQLRTVDTDRALSWANGQLFFDNERLASAVAEMNQYSRLKIVVDPEVADLRISGMFRTSNLAGFVDALQIALPVDVNSDGQGRILVTERPQPAAD